MNIKAAITDRFRKTYRSFKQDEQKLIDEAIDLWLANPDNPSSNFEKLNFQGGNIFSIRATRSWRIVMAKFDDTYFILHAGGQHDKVNDWARNKRIERNIITGAIQIYSTQVEEFTAVKSVTESDKKLVFESYSEEQIMALGVPKDWVETVQKVSSDEEYMQLWNYLPEDALENLQVLYDRSMDIKILIAQIEDQTKELPESTTELVKVQPGFHVISEDSSLMDELNKDINTFRFYLHPYQKYLAYGDFNGPIKATGSAGTGKTVVAMHRAKYLSDRLSEEDKPILFTTYTKFLIRNIKSLFAESGITESKLLITNLHHYALELGQKLEVFPSNINILITEQDSVRHWKRFASSHPEIELETEFLREEIEEVFYKQNISSLDQYKNIVRIGREVTVRVGERESIWDAYMKYKAFQNSVKQYTFDDIIFHLSQYLENWPEERPFGHVICDEVQDFSNLELRLLRNMVPEGPNDLFLAGDPFQNIYQRQTNFSLSGINIRGNRSTRLKLNYRTTEQIRQFAVKALAKHEFDDFSGSKASMAGDTSLLTGNEPVYQVFELEELEMEFVIDQIRQCFGKVRFHEVCITARTNDEVTKWSGLLEEAKIPSVNLQDIEDLSEANDRVIVSTMHGLKGLEFKELIVTGLSQDTFPFKPRGFSNWSDNKRNDYMKAESALLYVTFSRAISTLVVTGVGDRCKF